MESLTELQKVIRKFAELRQWDQFHSPRNLLLALSGELGELLAEFQWINDDEVPASLLVPEKMKAIRLEIADVLIYLIRLGDVLEVDLCAAVLEKMDINEIRYPVDQARRRTDKYTAYE